MFWLTYALFLLFTSIVLFFLHWLMFPKILYCEEVVHRKDSDIVVLGGSFNPLHMGHISMIKSLSNRHRKVFVIVCSNPSKQYMVSPEARCSLIKVVVTELGLQNVTVKAETGYLWRFALKTNAKKMYRGIRTWSKDGFSEMFLAIQNIVGPIFIGRAVPLPTVYLKADSRYVNVSSTKIRQCVKHGRSLTGLVPEFLESKIEKLYK